MNYRKLGTTDLVVSELCFGPMRFNPNEKNEKGQNALDVAIDNGVNFIHSSYEYETIELLGECLGKHPKRHDLFHIIKIPVPTFNEKKFDKAMFRKRIEDALRTLHTDRIDIVQHLHRGVSNKDVWHVEGDPERFAQFPEVIAEATDEFSQLKKEGKVGFLASFPMTPGYAGMAVKSGKYSALVAYFNLIETEMAQFFPEMKKNGVGFIAIRPLLRGMITDKRVNRNALPGDDPLKSDKYDDAYELFSKVRQVMPDPGMSWESFGVKYCLADAMVTSVVMGLNNPAQAAAAVEAADGNYPDMKLINEIRNAVKLNHKGRNTWN